MPKKTIVQLFQELADMTYDKCKAICKTGLGSCCSPEYCGLAIDYARTRFGVVLSPTGHPKLPLLKDGKCTAAPHFRPLCTAHICEHAYMRDLKFSRKYFQARTRASDSMLEIEIRIGKERKIR